MFALHLSIDAQQRRHLPHLDGAAAYVACQAEPEAADAMASSSDVVGEAPVVDPFA